MAVGTKEIALWLDVVAVMLESGSLKVRLKGQSVNPGDQSAHWFLVNTSTDEEGVQQSFKLIQEALEKNRLVQVKFVVPAHAEGFRTVSPNTPAH